MRKEQDMKTRTQVIKELKVTLEGIKDSGVDDVNDWALFKAICDIESAIEHLEENEE